MRANSVPGLFLTILGFCGWLKASCGAVPEVAKGFWRLLGDLVGDAGCGSGDFGDVARGVAHFFDLGRADFLRTLLTLIIVAVELCTGIDVERHLGLGHGDPEESVVAEGIGAAAAGIVAGAGDFQFKQAAMVDGKGCDEVHGIKIGAVVAGLGERNESKRSGWALDAQYSGAFVKILRQPVRGATISEERGEVVGFTREVEEFGGPGGFAGVPELGHLVTCVTKFGRKNAYEESVGCRSESGAGFDGRECSGQVPGGWLVERDAFVELRQGQLGVERRR
jgi:hypothetical protein